MNFLEMFQDYEEYHKEINTGKKIRAELIKGWIEENSTMLDVGIGDGLIAEYLMNELNVKMHGLDVSENACKKAKQKGIEMLIEWYKNYKSELWYFKRNIIS